MSITTFELYSNNRCGKSFKATKRPVTIKAAVVKKEFIIETLEGDMTANIGDILIEGVNGEVYPCKKDIFEKIYTYSLNCEEPKKKEED